MTNPNNNSKETEMKTLSYCFTGMLVLTLLGTSLPAQENELIPPAAPAPSHPEATPKPQALSARSAEVTGPYFGQTPPGKTPQIFAPGILSLNNRLEARIAFSPDGNECFFTVLSDFNFSQVRLYYTKCVSNVWTPQVLAPFSPSGTFCGMPFFSADGNTFYFKSNANGSGDIWKVDRTSQGWGTPQILPAPINTSSDDGEYSQTTDGTAYIESNRPGGRGQYDIWRILPQQPGQPLQLDNLGAVVNSSSNDGDPFISPDGRYLLFDSNRPGSSGYMGLYVTFTNGNGGWIAPVNMNTYCPGINIPGVYQCSPSLSPDQRYLFFVRLNFSPQQCDVWWVENPFNKNKPNPVP
jgi:Tol biopolymer transport system component